MVIAYFSNYFNHHQRPVAEAINAIEGVEYIFVCTTGVPEFRKKLGYQEMKADYVLDVTISQSNRQKAVELARTADVAIFGGGKVHEFAIERLKLRKLTFDTSERRFKRGYINMLSPNLLRHQWMYWRYGRKAPFYMLCCSAYTANDFYFLGSFIGKCYKWAYFTQVNDLPIEDILVAKRQPRCKIMWCSRFIDWKHPEMCIELAKRLLSDGADFEINMYGNGPLLEQYKQMVQKERLLDYVNIKGNRNNEEILAAMQQHNIFLFTSDQNEGWGAVVNEAMSNGCALVGSDKIGAIPFLVKNNVNGLIFKSNNIESLYNTIKILVSDRTKCEQLAREAYRSMRDVWSPKNAAKSLLTLINALKYGQDTPIEEGPCSKAEPTK